MVLHALATAGKVAEREENYRLEKAEGRSGRGLEQDWLLGGTYSIDAPFKRMRQKYIASAQQCTQFCNLRYTPELRCFFLLLFSSHHQDYLQYLDEWERLNRVAMFSRTRMLSNVESKSMKYPSWILKAREEKKGHEMKGPEARSGRAEASVSLRSLPHSASVFSQLLHCARGGGLLQHMYV